MHKLKNIIAAQFHSCLLKRKCISLLLSLSFFNTCIYCQGDLARTMEQNFAAYNKDVVQEKIYVHTDKSFYLAGETIWFRIYTVDANTHKQINISKTAYVEILDHTNKPVLQAMIELNNGDGDGSFLLP